MDGSEEPLIKKYRLLPPPLNTDKPPLDTLKPYQLEPNAYAFGISQMAPTLPMPPPLSLDGYQQRGTVVQQLAQPQPQPQTSSWPDCMVATSPISTVSVEHNSPDYSTNLTVPFEERAPGFIYKKDFSDYRLPSDTILGNMPTPVGLELLDQTIVKFMREQGIPGASMCISKRGKILHTQTFGWATHGLRVQPNHRFRIASVTKILTATGVMKLVEEGRLSLADKAFGPKGILCDLCPDCPGDRRLLRINVRHLLNHSAGWDRDAVGDPVFWKHVGAEMGEAEPVSQHTLIKYMMTQKLQFMPGTKHIYSNFGYEVLGRIIEEMTGQQYEAYIKQLLGTVGIGNMEVGHTRKCDTQPDEVEYFASERFNLLVESVYPEDGTVPAPYGGFAMETGDADGGWIATATDLVRFLNALDGSSEPSLLKRKTFSQMIGKPPYSKGTAWYGFGLDVSWNKKAWEHSGTLDGATSTVVHDRFGYTWAFLANYWPRDADYTSLIAYSITKVPKWCPMKVIPHRYADVVTLENQYLVNVALPASAYDDLERAYKAEGYQAKWINTYVYKNRLYFNMIWSNILNHQTIVHFGLTEQELWTSYENYNQQKFRIQHLDCYVIDNCVKYLVIYIGCIGLPQRLHCNLTCEELSEMLETMKESGYQMMIQAGAYVNGETRIAALFEHTGDDEYDCRMTKYWALVDMTHEKYQSEFDRHARFGHLQTYINPYNTGDGLRFSAVWTNPGPLLFTAEHEMSRYRVISDLQYAFEQNFYPMCITGYEDEDTMKFAAVCAKSVPAHSIR